MNEKSRRFGNSINCLIAKENFSREETKNLFLEILKGEQTEMHQGAFLSAITAKGPSAEEIAGAWQAIYEFDTVKVSPSVQKPLVDNCGTGMDSFKTFNISTGSAIVAAAGGVYLARHGARGITSRCGTVDLCEALGVDVDCPVEIVKDSIENVGVGLFNGMSPKVHPQALFRILSHMRFGNILNIAASLANPANPLYAVRGVYSKEMVMPIIRTMKEIGFRKAMVFCGQSDNASGSMDELSPFAESFIAELSGGGEIVCYTVMPEWAGVLYKSKISEISGGDDPQKEALRLLKVFTGQDKKGLYETICLNTAPVFYVAGEVQSLQEGMKKARDTIDSGQAMDKLRQWVYVQNRKSESGKKRLEKLLRRL
jgi:anthranilate phosphoribosyltransferase